MFEPVDGLDSVACSGHKAPVSAVSWSSGVNLASGSEDGTVILWNSGCADALCSFTAHSLSILCLVFCGDQHDYVAAGSLDHSVSLFDVRTQV
jgi:WD40 repeat protein